MAPAARNMAFNGTTLESNENNKKKGSLQLFIYFFGMHLFNLFPLYFLTLI